MNDYVPLYDGNKLNYASALYVECLDCADSSSPCDNTTTMSDMFVGLPYQVEKLFELHLSIFPLGWSK